MPLLPEDRAALHRRVLHDHLKHGMTMDTARWLTEADIHAEAVAEVMREREAANPESGPLYTGPKKV